MENGPYIYGKSQKLGCIAIRKKGHSYMSDKIFRFIKLYKNEKKKRICYT